jgi:hypothetical protein
MAKIPCKERLEDMAYILYRVLDGDDVDGARDILREAGFTDENDEWIYEED